MEIASEKQLTKKQKIGAITAAALSGALLLTGSLAYFTDRVDTNASATGGTVDISVAADWQDVANFNPGDQMDIGYTISSDGNKSVDVRETLVVKSSQAMADAGQAEFEIYRAVDVEQDGNGAHVPKNGAEPVATGADRIMSDDDTSIKYLIDEYVLNGTGLNAEVEDGITATSNESKYVLVFKDAADNDFQGADVSVELLAEAKQHRNTGTDTWEVVAKESVTMGGEAVDAVPAK